MKSRLMDAHRAGKPLTAGNSLPYGGYALGRVALNISQAGDEEGISHKPFQIAAAGVPGVHVARKGLADCFVSGQEIETFETPLQARDKIAALLAAPERRADLAAAAHARLCRDHTWIQRLPQLLQTAQCNTLETQACSDRVNAHDSHY